MLKLKPGMIMFDFATARLSPRGLCNSVKLFLSTHRRALQMMVISTSYDITGGFVALTYMASQLWLGMQPPSDVCQVINI